MISETNINDVKKCELISCLKKTIPFAIFSICFFICFFLDITYNENTSLINDKLIDVCSIFFGIFIGSLYLFNRFKSQETFNDFIIFCQILIFLNLLIISLSFVIIIVHEPLVGYSKEIKFHKTYSKTISINNIIYSFYIGLFGVTLYYISRYIKFVNIILKNIKSEVSKEVKDK